MPGVSQTPDLGSLSPQLQREKNSESTEDQCAWLQDTGCKPRPLHLASDPTFLSHFVASAAQPLSPPPGIKTLREEAGGQLIWGRGRLPGREDGPGTGVPGPLDPPSSPSSGSPGGSTLLWGAELCAVAAQLLLLSGAKNSLFSALVQLRLGQG